MEVAWYDKKLWMPLQGRLRLCACRDPSGSNIVYNREPYEQRGRDYNAECGKHRRLCAGGNNVCDNDAYRIGLHFMSEAQKRCRNGGVQRPGCIHAGCAAHEQGWIQVLTDDERLDSRQGLPSAGSFCVAQHELLKIHRMLLTKEKKKYNICYVTRVMERGEAVAAQGKNYTGNDH